MKYLIRKFYEWWYPKRVISADRVQSDDPVTREVVARCFNRGKSIKAVRDDHGNVKYTEF